LCNVIPASLIDYYHKSPAPQIRLKNGSIIGGIAAEAFQRTRGPQWNRAWCDEVAAWGEGGKADPEEVWDTMVMSVRLGNDTRILVTTTPKNRPLVKRLVADPDTVMTTASTHVNQDNLSKEFSRRILKYDGTKIGRQEVYAELIDSEEGGIISRSWLKHWPVEKPLPEFHFIVMSVDSAFSEEDRDKKKQTTDPTAVSVWGCFKTAVKPYVGVMLLDCWAEYLSYPDLVDRIKRESDPELIRYGSNLSQKPIILPGNIPKAYRKQMAPKVGGRPIDVIVIEGKANGKSLRQSLAKDGIATVQFNPTKDKLERGHFVSPIAKDGIIWVPGKEDKDGKRRFLSWAEPLVEQLCSYSGEGSLVHEDLYDTATQAWSTIDWYWLHHLNAKGKKDSKERAGTISEDHQPDRVVRNNPYAS
jgi:predicted phage terminase large subunit-like protein